MASTPPLLQDGKLSRSAREDFDKAREPHERARHLPGYVYTSEELFPRREATYLHA